MAIDPARLARIRARLVAAAAVTAAVGCGGGREYVNDRPPDRTINEPPVMPTASPDPNAVPEGTPAPEGDPKPNPAHVNTPPPNR